MDDLELEFGRIYPLYYEYGGQIDRRKAVAALRPLADRGFMPAVYYLGMAYFDGTGVRKNLEEALRLFRLAADAGYAAAQGMIGTMYAARTPRFPTGHDAHEAHRWFELAARGGAGGAQYNLAWRYSNGTEVEPDQALALAWASLAAKRSPLPFSAAEGLARQTRAVLDEASLARAEQLLATLEREVPVVEEPLFYWRRCAEATGYVEPPPIARSR